MLKVEGNSLLFAGGRQIRKEFDGNHLVFGLKVIRFTHTLSTRSFVCPRRKQTKASERSELNFQRPQSNFRFVPPGRSNWTPGNNGKFQKNPRSWSSTSDHL